MITVNPIPAFQDNYFWLIVNELSSKAVVVDPGEASVVLDTCQKNNLELSDILITHHHMDHIGGISGLLKYRQIPVYGPKNESIPQITHHLAEGDHITLPALDNLKLQILDIPGHTLGHIAYYSKKQVFCGDTLFAAGCGRLFEGTPEQMLNSLNKLKELPSDTLIYCAHEYTSKNLEFALQVEPNNQDLLKRIKTVSDLRKRNKPTLPSTLHLELATNPFLRTKNDPVIKSVERHCGQSLQSEVEVFAELRRWKDNF